MTDFHLATKPHHFRACHTLLRNAGRDYDWARFSTPTVMALRDGNLVGFIATAPLDKGVVMVGEMEIDRSIKQPIHLIMGMAETYDAYMAAAGVKEYLVPVPKDREKVLEGIKKVLGEPYRQDQFYDWFKRELK